MHARSYPLLTLIVCLAASSVLADEPDRFGVDAVLGGERFFHDRRLTVVGLLDLEFESQALRGQTGSLWVDFIGHHGHDRNAIRAALEASRPMREKAAPLNGRCVSITGTIRVGPEGNWMLWPVEIGQITDIEAAAEHHCEGLRERLRERLNRR
ncbi:hypothetical protein [Wenzhouxiangella marina]|uniref:Uncharacterized protein n=1 Tax=Wenzhouxiangella marina TaxID=1579979 RepID=A0A0K0XS23_9GAMM|nr:hypothetical protein [Wenzhouxiangella marina]AKS40455.1 hypothetical protein WM2015_64 [Wenzhouxiangella marina]MBB6088223.1 hypothetical protein [Wenzhouxiangella marina]